MKIKIQQFLGGDLFSWAIVGQSIGRALINKGHEVDFIPTDKGEVKKYFPKDLHNFLIKTPKKYDMQISYTAMHNFPHYLSAGNKNRFGIWNFDGTIVPPEMIKFCNFCDKLCPSSNFSKEVFLKAGIAEEKLVTIPHGINLEDYNNKNKLPLKTNKSCKILLNIASPHKRKNLKKTLEAFGKAFSQKDDVCLVIKANLKKDKKQSSFFVDLPSVLKKFKSKYKNHAEIEIIQGFVPSLIELYNSCDIIFMMSHFEQFWMPGLEGMAAGKMVVAARYGGQTHYLNDKNSLLIEGKVVRMPKDFQYWTPSPKAEMFEPSIDDAVDKLRYAVSNYQQLQDKFAPESKKTVRELTWNNVGQMFLDLVK